MKRAPQATDRKADFLARCTANTGPMTFRLLPLYIREGVAEIKRKKLAGEQTASWNAVLRIINEELARDGLKELNRNAFRTGIESLPVE